MAVTGAYKAWLPRDPQILTAGTISVPESASLTAKRGTPGLWDGSGNAAACTTLPTVIGFIFAEDGHNGSANANSVLVWPLRANQQWQVVLLDALALTQIADTELGIVQDTVTNFWYASTADTGAQCRAVDYLTGPAGFNIGDSKAAIFVEFHTTKIQVV